jgi:hypothetical protein
MKKKREKKSNRGRKPNRAVLSGIKPDKETWEEIRCRIIYGSNEWPMVALRQLIATDQRQKIAPFMRKLIADLERAVLNGDADWFRRQANATEKGGSPQRKQFNAKVVLLLEHAMEKTHSRPVSDLGWIGNEALTLMPAGMFTDQMASDIYDALEKHPWRTLVNGRWIEDKRQVVVEGFRFENKERVMDAIHDLAKRLQFELKKQLRKRWIDPKIRWSRAVSGLEP